MNINDSYVQNHDFGKLLPGDQDALNELFQMDMRNWPKNGLLLSVFILGFLTNGMVVFIYFASPIKKQRGFILVLNLAIADLLYLCILPISIYGDSPHNHFNTGIIGCVCYSSLRVSNNCLS